MARLRRPTPACPLPEVALETPTPSGAPLSPAPRLVRRDGLRRATGSWGRTRPRTVLVTAVLGVGAIAVAVFVQRDDGEPTAVPAGFGRVERHIDGDTVALRIDDVVEHVRIIGIDTPETHKPNSPVECFGPEAAARTAELLPVGTVVRMERDVEPRDRYGRLLAYVWLDDGRLLPEVLAAEGFAAPLDIAPNSAYRARIAAASAEARTNRIGLWGACGGPHEAR